MGGGGGGGSNHYSDNNAPPNTNSFLQTASMFSSNRHHHGLGFGKVFEERVYIPQDDYPNINFIGLILGPKGLNQKRMQTETQCRILVKGKGSSKNGINDMRNDPDEPLHVYISADTEEKVQIGVKKINDLIRESTDKYVEGGMEVKVHRHNGYIDVEIPNSQIGVVIGKQGNNIQRIQDITGATVMISPRNVPDNPLMKMITISGSSMQCHDALKEIYQTIEFIKKQRQKTGATIAADASTATTQQQQYAKVLALYGWTPEQIAAYQQYPQYYQQYYQQYAQQYPQQYAQYTAAMQQQMQAQVPPPPPPEEEDDKTEQKEETAKDESTKATTEETNDKKSV
eukprot:1033833_1